MTLLRTILLLVPSAAPPSCGFLTQSACAMPMMLLAGDTNQDTRVNVGDTNQTKANSGNLTNGDNFRTDVNLDGRINVGDTNFVKAHAGTPKAAHSRGTR